MILEWKKSYIEFIALYVHPKNSNHLRSHLRAIMALDHSRLGLENKFLENKSGRIFLRSTGLLYKFLPTNLGVCKPTFNTFYTSHLRWNSTIYHTDIGQNVVFHNFSRLIALSQYSGRSISGADPGFILGGGALFSCSTSTPINQIVWQNTSYIRKPQVISEGGRTPCTLPLDPPLNLGLLAKPSKKCQNHPYGQLVLIRAVSVVGCLNEL